jgi:hypothetical protein
MNYADVAAPESQANNMGGTKQRFWFAPISYFDTIAKPDPNATTLAGTVDITDSHTFLPGKGFHKCYITLDKNGVTFKPQGERDGRSYAQEFKGFTPGSSSTVNGLLSRAKNDRFIVLVEETDGVVNQLGTEDYYAEMVGEFTSGNKSNDLRGYTITVTSVANDNYRYQGTIVEFADEQGS